MGSSSANGLQTALQALFGAGLSLVKNWIDYIHTICVPFGVCWEMVGRNIEFLTGAVPAGQRSTNANLTPNFKDLYQSGTLPSHSISYPDQAGMKLGSNPDQT